MPDPVKMAEEIKKVKEIFAYFKVSNYSSAPLRHYWKKTKSHL